MPLTNIKTESVHTMNPQKVFLFECNLHGDSYNDTAVWHTWQCHRLLSTACHQVTTCQQARIRH